MYFFCPFFSSVRQITDKHLNCISFFCQLNKIKTSIKPEIGLIKVYYLNTIDRYIFEQ